MRDLRDSPKLDADYLDGIKILVVMPSVPVYGKERSNLQIMKMLREKSANILFVTDQLSD